MQNNKILMWFGGAVLVIVVVLIILLVPKKPEQPTQQAKQNKTNIGVRQDVPKGEVVAGFPKQVIQPNQTPVESYTIAYDGSQQFTTSLISSQSLTQVVKGYVDYFTQNKFVGIKQTPSGTTLVSVFAIKDNASYSLVIQQPNTKAKTTISVSVLKK